MNKHSNKNNKNNKNDKNLQMYNEWINSNGLGENTTDNSTLVIDYSNINYYLWMGVKNYIEKCYEDEIKIETKNNKKSINNKRKNNTNKSINKNTVRFINIHYNNYNLLNIYIWQKYFYILAKNIF